MKTNVRNLMGYSKRNVKAQAMGNCVNFLRHLRKERKEGGLIDSEGHGR